MRAEYLTVGETDTCVRLRVIRVPTSPATPACTGQEKLLLCIIPVYNCCIIVDVG